MKKIILYCGIICATSLLYGCGNTDNRNTTTQTKTNSSNVNVSAIANKPEPPTNPKTSFENDLFNVRVADVEQVLVFRRKDDAVLTADDKKFLRENSPNETGNTVNRWLIDSKDGKFAIAGTNFYFTPEQIAALQGRFNVKDFSKGDGVEMSVSDYSAEMRERIEKARDAKKKK